MVKLKWNKKVVRVSCPNCGRIFKYSSGVSGSGVKEVWFFCSPGCKFRGYMTMVKNGKRTESVCFEESKPILSGKENDELLKAFTE